jgi:hypothetical protein
MSSTLNIQINLSGDHNLITGSLAAGGTLPQAVFIYENTGTGALGTFFGTCNVQELGRLQVFTPGTAIPLFGNKHVRHDQIKIVVPLDKDPSAVVNALVQNVKTLSLAYARELSVSTSYNIP